MGSLEKSAGLRKVAIRVVNSLHPHDLGSPTTRL